MSENPPASEREADNQDYASQSDYPASDARKAARRARRAARKDSRGTGGATRFLKEVTYPHSIHPALVPGVSVEEQRIRYGVDKPIVLLVGGFILAFVIWGIWNPQQVFDVSSAALSWVMLNLGWIFTVLAVGLVFVLLALAFSRYGKIPLGVDGEKPEYSTMSWAAMLFAAGIGIAIIFFGPYEPMSHYLAPRPGSVEPASQDAVLASLSQAAMHFGVNAWAIYGVVGLCVAYVSYRRGRVPLMSSILMPFFRKKDPHAWPARVIDGLAIVATLFGTAASLGLGALQIGQGVTVVTGWSSTGNNLAIILIAVLTCGTIASAVSGVAKGIRWLSNINLVLSIGLALFFFVLGPTAFLMNTIPAVFVDYLSHAPDMLTPNMGQGEEMQTWLSSWSTFYWAWWVSWAPFVGIFVAKISRGRTIRQFVLGVLFIPSTIIILAFTILGGTSIWLQRTAGDIAPGDDVGQLPAPERVFFVVLDHLPGASVMAPIVIVMLAIFFITTADSASLVNSQLSQGGNPSPKRLVTAFWGLCMAGIAVVILVAGGANALKGLQNLVTVTALPFAVIMVGMVVALLRELRNDPRAIRSLYASEALNNAVVHGVHDYGDDFAIAVEKASKRDYATGADFDSTASEVTEWYRRTDEEGRPVGYDYETGRYLDELEAQPTPEQSADPKQPDDAPRG